MKINEIKYNYIKNKVKTSNLKIKEKDAIAIATIAGGIAGGLITDKENSKAKANESIFQLIVNYIVPTIAVGGSIKLFLLEVTSLLAGFIAGNIKPGYQVGVKQADLNINA